MSSLYIRVRTGFYTNRKTVRLRLKIGDDAYWIPPRLWAYCAENQPDGDLSGYASEELAELIGCVKHATSMLQALKDAGFLTKDGKIHDWAEHNGYHEAFSTRAKAAAAARWSKSPRPPESGKGKRKEERGDKHCSSNAPSIPPQDQPDGTPPVENNFPEAERPSKEEFFAYFDTQACLLPAKWYVEDKWLAAQSDNWKGKDNWRAYAQRVKGWWEADGRPASPKTAKAIASGKPVRSDVVGGRM